MRKVLGCLLGKQKGRTIEITNSFELTHASDDGKIVLDTGFLTQRQEQYKQTFEELELLGWYTTGEQVEDEHLAWCRAISCVTENPLCLLLDPESKGTHKGLPVHVYHTEMKLMEGEVSNVLVESKYEIEAVEAERIAIDQVSKILEQGQSGVSGQVSLTMSNVMSATLLLRKRVLAIRSIMKSMQAGELAFDHALVRQVCGLVQKLPAFSSEGLRKGLLIECNDTILVTYLSGLTKQALSVLELTEKLAATKSSKFYKRRQLLGAL